LSRSRSWLGGPIILGETDDERSDGRELGTDAGAVDLLGEVPGVDSIQAVWQRSQEVELLGTAVRIASLADLIAMKRAAGRPERLHLRELERLLALQESGKTSDA
jgi:hypothetical protein